MWSCSSWIPEIASVMSSYRDRLETSMLVLVQASTKYIHTVHTQLVSHRSSVQALHPDLSLPHHMKAIGTSPGQGPSVPCRQKVSSATHPKETVFNKHLNMPETNTIFVKGKPPSSHPTTLPQWRSKTPSLLPPSRFLVD